MTTTNACVDARPMVRQGSGDGSHLELLQCRTAVERFGALSTRLRNAPLHADAIQEEWATFVKDLQKAPEGQPAAAAVAPTPEHEGPLSDVLSTLSRVLIENSVAWQAVAQSASASAATSQAPSGPARSSPSFHGGRVGALRGLSRSRDSSMVDSVATQGRSNSPSTVHSQHDELVSMAPTDIALDGGLSANECTGFRLED